MRVWHGSNFQLPTVWFFRNPFYLFILINAELPLGNLTFSPDPFILQLCQSCSTGLGKVEDKTETKEKKRHITQKSKKKRYIMINILIFNKSSALVYCPLLSLNISLLINGKLSPESAVFTWTNYPLILHRCYVQFHTSRLWNPDSYWCFLILSQRKVGNHHFFNCQWMHHQYAGSHHNWIKLGEMLHI